MSVLERVVTWLAPPACVSCGREGTSICERCAAGQIMPFGERCWRCNKLSAGSKTCQSCRHTGSPGQVFIVTNYEGVPRDLLRIYKFGQQRAASEAIAGLMSDFFIRSSTKTGQKDYAVIPIPTATARIRERGFDHTELLAQSISGRLRLRQINALRRLGQTRQLGSRREDRLVQLADSFVVRKPARIEGQYLLLIDDVVTTGGTIIAAARTLRAAGAKSVDALIFAKRL